MNCGNIHVVPSWSICISTGHCDILVLNVRYVYIYLIYIFIICTL